MKPLASGSDSGYTFGITGGDTMSKAISVKLDERVFQEAEKMVRRKRTNRNAYINKAIRLLNRLERREMLRGQLERESLTSRKEIEEVLRDFDGTVGDGLEGL
jgi:Arc/MetJ-type ribon-helix-helix transcriptional regulator